MNRSPVWTPDGGAILFQSDDTSTPGLYWTRADGRVEAQRLTDGKRGEVPGSFSPDGRRLAFHQTGVGGSLDLFTATFEGDRAHPRLGAPELFLGTPASEFSATFSPDGRWLAYTSSESGEFEIYGRPFPGPGGRWQISNDSGLFPIWSRSGSELLFRDVTGRLMAAKYSVAGDSFVASKPRLWSQTPVLALPNIGTYDLVSDGTRLAAILAASDAVQDSATRLTFLVNFFDEIRRQAP